MKIANYTTKEAKRIIRKKPMPCSLEKEFKNNGLSNELEKVYIRSAELLEENKNVSKTQMTHLEQILPCIAFYETLIEIEGSKDKALKLYDGWCLKKIEKIGKIIPIIMKFPGLYKKAPSIMDKMLDKLFGAKAGFEYRNVECNNGFAADMLICPYVEMCKKYGCIEIAQYFCKSDDLTYGNMHPKVIWARTKTLGTGGDCCDFKILIKD